MSGATPHGSWARESAVIREAIPRTAATVVRRALRAIGDRQPVTAKVGAVVITVQTIRCEGITILVRDSQGREVAPDSLEFKNAFGATERYRRQA